MLAACRGLRMMLVTVQERASIILVMARAIRPFPPRLRRAWRQLIIVLLLEALDIYC